jgi:hypothetical protein
MGLDELAKKSLEIKKGAEGLKRRILEFEGWLSNMKGRVETKYVHSPQLALVFKRQGKEWRIFIEKDKVEKLLADSSLHDKMLGMRHFPDLLLAIADAQDELLKRLESGIQELDAFTQSLKVYTNEPPNQNPQR